MHVIEIRKIEKSLTFTVCRLLISQVHCNGLKLWILNDEICVANSDCLIISSHITNLNKINEKKNQIEYCQKCLLVKI